MGPRDTTARGVLRLRAAFLLRTFDVGGSERQLVALTRGLVDRTHEVLAVIVEGGGTLVPELSDAGARVTEVTDGGIRRLPAHRLLGPLRRFRPDVLHGYLAFGNTLAVLCRPFLPRTPVVQGIRVLRPERDPARASVRALYHAEALSSRFAAAVIANSHAGCQQAVERGFPENRLHVVPNGIDTDALRFDPIARKRVRAEWSVDEDEVLIGRVGRMRPTKDYPTFLRAAAAAARQRDDLRFVAVGDGPDQTELRALAAELGLDRRLVWGGERGDMGAVMSALDVMASSSVSESFPNVIGEAMACGVPCVVTAAGDSGLIVGEIGLVVPPSDPESLADAIVRLAARLPKERDQLRAGARRRVDEQFGVEAMVTATECILEDVVARHSGARR